MAHRLTWIHFRPDQERTQDTQPFSRKQCKCHRAPLKKKSWGAAPSREERSAPQGGSAPLAMVSVSRQPHDQAWSSIESDRATESQPAWTSHRPLPKPGNRGPERARKAAATPTPTPSHWSQQSQTHLADKCPPGGCTCPRPPAPGRDVTITRTDGGSQEPERVSREVV